MIVEPDFLDHWKTRLLVRLLGTELAPIYVIRLWAHCQSRKTDRFTDWKPTVLASVCRWETDPQTLWDAMLETYLERDGNTVVARGWAETNAGLISAWTNGKLGGRPKKQAKPTDQKPEGNRPDNRIETVRVTDREEKRREDREEKTGEKRSRFVPPTREELDLEASKLALPSIEVDKFVNYYASKGWKVGTAPMKSWTHALAGWAARCRERAQNPITGGNRYQTATADDAAF